MASPQKEDGYTPIANELLERLSRMNLNGSQFRIIMIVWRYTYGFNRKQAELSQSFIANAIGTSRPTVSRELKLLISANIVTLVKAAGFNASTILGFNKNFDDWKSATRPSTDTDQVSDTLPGIQSDTSTPDGYLPGIQSDTLPGIQSDTQERKIKDKLKKGARPRHTPKNVSRKKCGKYGWVLLSEDEFNRMVDQYGREAVAHYVRVVDELAQQTGNRNGWKDWNLTVRKAIRDKWGNGYSVREPTLEPVTYRNLADLEDD